MKPPRVPFHSKPSLKRRNQLLWVCIAFCYLVLIIHPYALAAGQGLPIWTNHFRGFGMGGNTPAGVSVDEKGNVFVVATSSRADLRSEIATIAYSSVGAALWTNRYAGPGVFQDYAVGVVADGGNIYVTGSSSGIGSAYEYVTLAYSFSGAPLWTNRYSGMDGGVSWPTGIAADKNNGNIYVTGYSPTLDTDWDCLTLAFSKGGMPLWTNRTGGRGVDRAFSLAVAGNGNVVLAGESDNHTLTFALSSSGIPLWTNRYNGFGNSDTLRSVAVDAAGNVFVTGTSRLQGGDLDYLTLAYSALGTPMWTNRFQSAFKGDDEAGAIAVDRSGNVFVAGSSTGFGDKDYVTLAYSPTGIPLWTNRYDGPAFGYDEASRLSLDAAGNIYVTGLSDGGDGKSFDLATIAYSNDGVPIWTNRFNGIASGEDLAKGITVDVNGDVLVTGSSIENGGVAGIVTIKYAGQGSMPAPEQISVEWVDGKPRLRWGNPAFVLQSAPTAIGPFKTTVGAVSPYPLPSIDRLEFYRLKFLP